MQEFGGTREEHVTQVSDSMEDWSGGLHAHRMMYLEKNGTQMVEVKSSEEEPVGRQKFG